MATACSDNPGSPDPGCDRCDPLPQGLFVSNPILAAPLNGAAREGPSVRTAAAAGDSVVYVSLAPTTEPEGVIATVRLLSSVSSVTTPLGNGGFDPVPLHALEGDTVEVFVRDAAGRVLRHTVEPVAAARQPVVVRANPPPQKRDVPLNSVMVLVFSEPIAAGSITPTSVQLLHGSVPVPGSAHLLAGSATAVAFVPTVRLAPNGDYRLVATPAVTDLDGETLAASVSVAFSTGTTVLGAVSSVRVHPDSADVSVGSQFQLTVTARDSADREVSGRPTIWSTCVPTVINVSAAGLVTALAEGYGCVIADVDGVQGVLNVTVSSSLIPVASVSVQPESARMVVGDSVLLNAVARDSTGQVLNRRLMSWTSTNSAVASVAATEGPGFGGPWATVRGLAHGTTRIIVMIEGRSDTSVVRVDTMGPIVDLVLLPSRPTVVLRDTVRLTAFGRDAAGSTVRLTSSQVSWVTSNPTVAVVDNAGLVRAGVVGDSTTISASWNGRQGTATVDVIALSFSSMAGGGLSTCGVTPNGAAFCWGYGWDGQLGIGKLGWAFLPTAVAGGLTFSAIDAAWNYACGLADTGIAYCWGLNASGPSGCPNGPCALTPVAVAGDLRFMSLRTGGGIVCGLTTTRETYCWRPYGEPSSPILVDSTLAFTSISVGTFHGCGITSTGQAYCWGYNAYGQLGTGDNVTSSDIPRAVAGGLTFASLSAGESHTCGLTTSGGTVCWGTPSAYGYGGSLAPAPVMNGFTFTTLSGSGGYTCGLTSAGAIQCWDDWGPAASRAPWTVPGNLVFTRMNAGGSGHACAITATDVAYCWGRNDAGQLGIGSSGDYQAVPVKVGGQP